MLGQAPHAQTEIRIFPIPKQKFLFWESRAWSATGAGGFEVLIANRKKLNWKYRARMGRELCVTYNKIGNRK